LNASNAVDNGWKWDNSIAINGKIYSDKHFRSVAGRNLWATKQIPQYLLARNIDENVNNWKDGNGKLMKLDELTREITKSSRVNVPLSVGMMVSDPAVLYNSKQKKAFEALCKHLKFERNAPGNMVGFFMMKKMMGALWPNQIEKVYEQSNGMPKDVEGLVVKGKMPEVFKKELGLFYHFQGKSPEEQMKIISDVIMLRDDMSDHKVESYEDKLRKLPDNLEAIISQ
jgi:hypothetical protein